MPESTDSPITICTVEDGCPEPAIATYLWPWGDSGACCARHQVVLQQRAGQLKRQVSITPLRPGAEQPVTRAERIQSKATILALETEIEETRERGMELYRSVTELQSRVKTLMAQKAEMEAQLQSMALQLDAAREENGELRQQAANENAELQQLRALVPLPPPQELDGPRGP